MKPPLAMAKPWREPMDHNGSPIVARRASPAASDVPLEFGRFSVLLRSAASSPNSSHGPDRG